MSSMKKTSSMKSFQNGSLHLRNRSERMGPNIGKGRKISYNGSIIGDHNMGLANLIQSSSKDTLQLAFDLIDQRPDKMIPKD